MRAYIIRLLLLVVPTLFILSVLVFLSVRFIPGDVIDIMASRMLDTGGEVDRELVERRLGLDLPIHVQYGGWIGGILLRGTNLGMFLIPSLILGTYLSASTMRMTRTMMLEVLRQDYVRTAWAKGLLERSVILRHAVKNAIIPVVTLVGMQLPILVGGSVIIENIFNLPGLGRLMLDALNDRDYPVVSAINLFFATVVVVSLLTDLVYASLDPRIRYE